MILKNIKFRSKSLTQQNVLIQPGNMAPVGLAYEGPWPNTSWIRGSDGPLYAGPSSGPNSEYPGAVILSGQPSIFASSNNVFQSYPYSRLTTYRASVWIKHESGTGFNTIAERVINVVTGDCNQQSYELYPGDFTSGGWRKIELVFTTSGLPKNEGCVSKTIQFAWGLSGGKTVAITGAELFITNAGPDLFNDWPSLFV